MKRIPFVPVPMAVAALAERRMRLLCGE